MGGAMEGYLLLKLLHVVSATILFGTGIGSAFCLFMANRSGDAGAIGFAARHVVIADWLFTMPAVLLQLASGLVMVVHAGHDLTEPWLLWSLILYFFAGACWVPVVWIQIRMRDLAKRALVTGTALPPLYWRLDRWWTILGALAFPAILVVFFLMVFKPA